MSVINPNHKFAITLLSMFLFFTLTPAIIATSLLTLLTLDKQESGNVDRNTTPNVQIYAAYPNTLSSTSINLISSDARGDILKDYFQKYNSPLEPYSYYIVNLADEYDVDFRLITAIARQESNLCKFIPDNTFNCWGWGIHSRGTMGFPSYEDAIKTVTEGLKKDYIDRGYNTPDEIMKKYTPLSDGSWAAAVNQFIGEME